MDRLALVAALAVAVGCGGDDGDDPADGGADDAGSVADAGADAGPVAGADSLAQYLDATCPWESLCNQRGLESCYSLLSEDDPIIGYIGNLKANGIDAAADCARAATSCTEYAACPEQNSVFGDPSGLSCPGDRELVCDEATDIMMWCIGAAAGEPPAIALDLTLDGQSCGPGDSVGDEPTVSCNGDVCDGSERKLCVTDRVLTSDCANWHPDYTCIEQSRCGVAVPECADNNFTNSGGSAQCGDAATATVCMGGKSFAVSCAAVGGTCVDVDEYEARCDPM